MGFNLQDNLPGGSPPSVDIKTYGGDGAAPNWVRQNAIGASPQQGNAKSMAGSRSIDISKRADRGNAPPNGNV